MTGNTIAPHLNFMRNRQRRPRQGGAPQAGRWHTLPVGFNKKFGLGYGNMTLSAGLLLGVRRNGRVLFQLFRPTAPEVTGQTFDSGQIRLFDFMGNKPR